MNAFANDLKSGSKIHWYQIESVLGRGGFGITYLTTDENLNQLVAIKEYLPHEFGTRSGDSTVQPISVAQKDVYDWGLERFMSEAQTLAKFNHPNIVRVLTVFKENNTGYMVMEYEQGEDLSGIYKQKWNLSQRELEDVYYPIIDGLASVHKEGFIHRDIKPANIYIRSDGSPVLLDFGAARQAVGTKTLTSMLSIGYAPFEQYSDAQGKQGAWTDIYALGASLHQGITGVKPPESTIRSMAVLYSEPDPYQPLSQSNVEGYTPAFLRAIDEALMSQINDRPQTLEEFLGMLKGEIKLPDFPKVDELDPEATVVRSKTVVRPGKKKLTEVDATDPDKYAKTEIIAPAEKVPPLAAKAVNKQTPESRPAKQGISTTVKILVAMAGIAAIIIAVVIFFPGLKLPGGITTQTAEKIPTPKETQTAEEIQTQKVNSLLKKAGELITSGKYYDKFGKGALSIYQQVLSIDSANTAAKNGINNVGQHYLLRAGQFINDKDFAQANESLEIVNSIDPGFPGLKEALRRLSENIDNEKKFKKVEIFLGQAGTALKQGQIYEPEQKSAIFYYQNVLKLDPDNVTAQQGLFKIADTLIDGAQAAIKESDTKGAGTLIRIVESIDPDNSAIHTIREQIDAINELKNVLAKADSAYAKNRYTTPKNDNSYQLYKQVLAIAPSNPHAQERLNKIADYYADRTRSYTQSGNIASANINLDTLATYFPNDSSISKLKRAIERVAALQQGVADNKAKLSRDEAAKVTVEDRTLTPGSEFNDCLYCPRMVVIPAGGFSMGSNTGDSDEKPVHQVTIKQPFALGKYEVTFNEYDAFARATNHPLPSDSGWGRATSPVINVSWKDALAYTSWLGGKTGKSYRLPSESEWEYAARATTSTTYSFGNSERLLCQYGNHADMSTDYFGRNRNCSDGVARATAEVGSYKGNPFGLHDMHGNVREWVEDCYVDSYRDAPVDGGAYSVDGCPTRVLRGGSWRGISSFLRSTDRSGQGPSQRRNTDGFRVVQDLGDH